MFQTYISIKTFSELIHAFSLIKEQVNANLKLALVGKVSTINTLNHLKLLLQMKEWKAELFFMVIFLMKNYPTFMCFVNYLFIRQHVKIVQTS